MSIPGEQSSKLGCASIGAQSVCVPTCVASTHGLVPPASPPELFDRKPLSWGKNRIDLGIGLNHSGYWELLLTALAEMEEFAPISPTPSQCAKSECSRLIFGT